MSADPVKTKPKTVAIVTGASAGLGAEFALQLEKRYFFDEIWLVARRDAPMRELADKFLKAQAVIIPLDLTRRSDLAALGQRLAEEKPEIEFLVNNAGLGKYGPFAELGLDEQVQMLDLNVTALTWLTRAAIPYMKPGASIIQVASAAAFSPSPYFAVYAATKSFVVSFSDALGYELRDHGIRVVAVCPGPVETEFFSVARRSTTLEESGEEPAKRRAFLADPRAVVAKALADLERGRRHSVFGTPIRLFARFAAFLPLGFRLRAMAKRNWEK
jgi:short-subunit dehydrogenase